MSDANIYISFKLDSKDAVDKFREVFSGKYNGDNSKCEEMFGSINPKIAELMKQTHNGNKNLEWLDSKPLLKKTAQQILGFDELEKDYKIWMHWTKYYDEAFGESEFYDKDGCYEIFVAGNEFKGAFVQEMLRLAGAYDIEVKEQNLDWDE